MCVFLPKFKGGFTLIELLVVMSIIIILSSAFFLNYRNMDKEFALKRAAYKLTQDVRRAGEMAMSAQKCCGSPGTVPSGYGIWLERNTNSYILYADIDGDEFFNQAADTKIEPSIGLEGGVVIQDISTNNKKVAINFRPPSPIIKLNWQPNRSQDIVTITLSCCNGSKTVSVEVNAVGLTEVK